MKGTEKENTDSHFNDESGAYEDEINLVDYFLVIFRYKWFIIIASLLPAMLVGAYLYFSPRTYEVTYVYDVRDDVRDLRLTSANYNILLSQIYSKQNLDKITKHLHENDFGEYASRLRSADDPTEFLRFAPYPPYIDISKQKTTDPDQIRRLQELTAQTISMTLAGQSKSDLPKIVSVIRDNFEKTVPVYSLQREMAGSINSYRTRMADIEANRFTLELSLKTNKDILAGLSKIQSGDSSSGEDSVTLQFDVGGKSQYLPLGYQIRAIETEIVELENQMQVNVIKYEYYKGLLELNQQLHAELKADVSFDYTIDSFHSFLAALYAKYDAGEIKDYLTAYTKRIENRISASVPVSQNPTISKIARGTVKKSAIVFMIAFMMSVFASFIREGFRKNY